MGILEVVTIDNAENSTEHRKVLTEKYFLTQYLSIRNRKMLNCMLFRTLHSDTTETLYQNIRMIFILT